MTRRERRMRLVAVVVLSAALGWTWFAVFASLFGVRLDFVSASLILATGFYPPILRRVCALPPGQQSGSGSLRPVVLALGMTICLALALLVLAGETAAELFAMIGGLPLVLASRAYSDRDLCFEERAA